MLVAPYGLMFPRLVMKVLLLGTTGQVGWELARRLPRLGELVTTSRTGGDADLPLDTSDLVQLRATLDAVAPDVIVNAAAYTAVDKAEQEPELAMRLNAEVPGVIGDWAAANGALVIHYSTDYVFDGSKDGPYVETDTPNPLNVYGRTKLAGDEALLASGCNAIILRVSWVYGMRGSNFLLTMRRLMAERGALKVVDDQIGAPTWCGTIAEATTEVLGQAISASDEVGDLCGLYHLAPGGETSWFGFAMAIRETFGLDCELAPIPTTEYPTPAKRPLNSRMDCTKLLKTFGIGLPGWHEALRECVDRA